VQDEIMRCRADLGEKQGKKGRTINDVTFPPGSLKPPKRYLGLCVSNKRYSFKPPNNPLPSAISLTAKNGLPVLVVLDSLVLTQLSPLEFSTAAQYAGMIGWWTFREVVGGRGVGWRLE
jgi:hypothetical protein